MNASFSDTRFWIRFLASPFSTPAAPPSNASSLLPRSPPKPAATTSPTSPTASEPLPNELALVTSAAMVGRIMERKHRPVPPDGDNKECMRLQKRTPIIFFD